MAVTWIVETCRRWLLRRPCAGQPTFQLADFFCVAIIKDRNPLCVLEFSPIVTSHLLHSKTKLSLCPSHKYLDFLWHLGLIININIFNIYLVKIISRETKKTDLSLGTE